MSTPPEEPIGSARPSFEVAGKAHGRLSYDLLELEVCQVEEGMTSLEMIVRNWGRRDDRDELDFLYFDDEQVQLGAALKVRLGEPAEDTQVFEGVITEIAGLFTENLPSELRICAEDRLQFLRMHRASRSHQNADDAAVLDRVANDHGLTLDARTRGLQRPMHWQINRSDLGSVRERARAADAVLDLQGSRMTLAPKRDQDTSVRARMRWFQNLLRFEVRADLAHQRRSVHVHGWDPGAKKSVHAYEEGAPARSEALAPGRTGPEVLASMEIPAQEHIHVDMPTTYDEARHLAQLMARRRARRFVCGHGVSDGTPTLRVRDRVELLGLGAWFSGLYHVVEVRHVYNVDKGLRTHFEVERTELGEARS